MKILNLILLIIICSGTSAQAQKADSSLIKLIDSLYTADQATALIRPGDSAAAAYQRVIRSNFFYTKQILDTYGFPGYDFVGKETSGKYFLLVQHSDFDVEFQKRALNLMKKQVLKTNASGQNYAFLVDRTNLNEGKPQIYGTQIIMSGNTQLKPCRDIKNLDKRRKSVGLEPVKEYLEKCNDVFYQMNPGEKKPEKKNPN
ncbi:MAG: hypothetical protein JNM14_11400 [Ferruginibacter sp.]|nr:hypothetical protein [Ferruginibacter sp.]